jgi:hypothetical protein
MAHDSPLLPSRLLSSFNERLPWLYCSKDSKYELRDSTTPSTILSPAPIFFYYRPAQELELEADRYMDKARIQDSVLDQLRIPTYLSGCRFETEGDVVFNSTLYSILPCLEVIEHFYPEKWKVRIERSVVLNMPLHDFDFSKLPEGKKPPTDKSTVRYDLIFETVPPEGQIAETLAIIEYKGAGLIRYEDYGSAVLNADEAEAEVQRQREAADQREVKTRLVGNGATFSQQGNKYAQNQRCSHVAIFNWDNLLLHELPLGRRMETRGMKSILTWVVEDERLKQGYMEVGYIRKVLLGWLVKAFEAHLGPPVGFD